MPVTKQAWILLRLIPPDAGTPKDDAAFRAGQGEYIHQQGPAPQQLEADQMGFGGCGTWADGRGLRFLQSGGTTFMVRSRRWEGFFAGHMRAHVII